MNIGSNNFYLIAALVVTSFIAGRFYANGTLMEENQKLKESVRLLRGEKPSVTRGEPGQPWKAEKPANAVSATPTPSVGASAEAEKKPASPVEAGQNVATASTATPPVIENPHAETLADTSPPTKVAVLPQKEPEPMPARAQETPDTAPKAAVKPGSKTSKKWVSDLGDHVQGTATYYHCNNSTLVAKGMEYYAYGSIPASRLKKSEDAYSVKDGRAIVISGCWSPKLGKAILYRKSDGQRWEPTFNMDDGSWTPVLE